VWEQYSRRGMGADSRDGRTFRRDAQVCLVSVAAVSDQLTFAFFHRYFYSDPVYLVGETDGTRIISNENCEFLQIVPREPPSRLSPRATTDRTLLVESSQDVFRPGSASPSAILFEAAELFEKRSPKADEYIRNIRTELVAAVDTCIDAAGREFEVYWQKKLLRVRDILSFRSSDAVTDRREFRCRRLRRSARPSSICTTPAILFR
jgi:hypothetical protein